MEEAFFNPDIKDGRIVPFRRGDNTYGSYFDEVINSGNRTGHNLNWSQQIDELQETSWGWGSSSNFYEIIAVETISGSGITDDSTAFSNIEAELVSVEDFERGYGWNSYDDEVGVRLTMEVTNTGSQTLFFWHRYYANWSSQQFYSELEPGETRRFSETADLAPNEYSWNSRVDFGSSDFAVTNSLETTDLIEDQYDYLNDWTSKWHDVKDDRLTLQFQYVSTAEDVLGNRPRFETFDTQVKVVKEEVVTQWKTELITQDDVIFVTTRIVEEGPLRDFGAFGDDTVRAGGNISMDAGQDILLSGIVNAFGSLSEVTISADRDVTVVGSLPQVLNDADNTVPARSEVKAGSLVDIDALRRVDVADSGSIRVDNGGADALDRIELTAGTELIVEGELFALEEIALEANDDAQIKGTIAAGQQLDVNAGLDGTGNVLGDIFTDLSTFQGGGISINAGAVAGRIDFTNSTLATTGTLNLTAPVGSVIHGGGLMIAEDLNVNALSGFTANAGLSLANIVLSGEGNVTITNQGDLVLNNIILPDGRLTVLAVGAVEALNVELNGGGDEDDFDLTTLAASNGFSSVTLRDVTIAGEGDLLIVAQNGSLATLGELIADEVDLEVQGGITLNSNINEVAIRATGLGDIEIFHPGAETLTVRELDVLSGAIQIATGGNLILQSTNLRTNAEANDITLDAGGDIQFDALNAGLYAATEAEANGFRIEFLNAALRGAGIIAQGDSDLDLAGAQALDAPTVIPQLTAYFESNGYVSEAASAEATALVTLTKTFTSLGDITLTAGGTLLIANPNDSIPDFVVDELRIDTEGPLPNLEIAGNALPGISAQIGDIAITDFEGVGEFSPGSNGVEVTATSGSVRILSPEAIEIINIDAPSAGADVMIESQNGSILVVEDPSGISIQSGGTASLIAPIAVVLGGGVSAPESQEFRSRTLIIGEEAKLETVQLILEADASFVIDGSMDVSGRIELISNAGNITVEGGLSGATGVMDEIVLIARGNRITEGVANGMFEYRDTTTGELYYKNDPEMGQGDVFEIAGGALVSIDDTSALHLIPVRQIVEQVVKEPLSGLEMFVDGQDTVYTRDLVTGEYFAWQDAASRFYRFNSFIHELKPGETDVFLPGEMQTFWSTTQDPTAGTIYRSNKITEMLNAQDLDLAPQFIEVSDSALAASLTPVTEQFLAGDIIFSEGVDLLIEGVDRVTANSNIFLKAFGEISGENVTLRSTGANGTLTMSAGDDISLEGWTLEANQRVTIGSSSSSRTTGEFIGGNVTLNSTLGGFDQALQQLEINAQGYINLGGNAEAAISVDLKANGNVRTTGTARISTDALTIGAGEGVDIQTNIAALDLALTGPGDVTVSEQDGLVIQTMSAVDGSVTLDTGDLTVNPAIDASGAVTINSTGGVDLNGSVTSNGGAIAIEAAGTVNLGAGQKIDNENGSSDVSVNAQVFEMGDGSSVSGADGTVTLTTGNDLAVTTVSSTGAVTITSSSGSVTGGEITSGSLTVNGATSITLNDTVTANGDIELVSSSATTINGSVSALGSVSANSGDTVNVSGTIESGGPLAVHTISDIVISGSVGSDGSVSLQGGETINSTGTVASGSDLSAIAAGNLVFGTITATGSATLNSVTGSVNGTNLTAAGAALSAGTSITLDGVVNSSEDLNLTSASDMTVSGTVTAQGSVTVNSGGVVNATGSIESGANLTATGAGNFVFGTITATGTATLTSQTGSINGTNLTAASAALSAGTAIALDGVVNSSGELNLTSASDTTVSGTVTVAGSVNVTSGGFVDVSGTLDSGTTLEVQAVGNIVVTGSVDSAASSNLQSGGVVDATGTIESGADLTVTASGDLGFATVTTIGSATVTSQTGSINGANLTSEDASLSAETSITLHGVVNSSGDINLSSGNDTTVSGTVTAQGSVTVDSRAAADISGSIESGADVAVTSAGNLDFGTITATGTTTLTSQTGIIRGTDLTAASATLSAASSITLNGVVNSDGDLNLTSGTDTTVNGTVTAQGSVTVNSDGVVKVNGTLDSGATLDVQSGGDIVVAGSVDSVGSATLQSGGAVNVTGAIGAEANLTVTAENNVVYNTVEAVGIATLTSQTGSVNGTSLRAAGAVLNGETGIGDLAPLATSVNELSAITSSGDIHIGNNTSGDVVVSSLSTQNGDVRFRQQTVDNLIVTSVVVNGGNVLIDLAGENDVALAVTNLATAELATLRSSGSVELDGSITLSGNDPSNEAGLNVEAGSTITIAASASINTQGSHVRMSAGDNVTIAGLNAGAGVVSVLSKNGNLLDGGDLSVDIQASAVRVNVGGGIGELGQGVDNAMEVNTSRLSVVSGPRGVNILNAGALEVGVVGVTVQAVEFNGGTQAVIDLDQSGLVSSGAVVLQTAVGNVTVSEVVDIEGDLRISADGQLSLNNRLEAANTNLSAGNDVVVSANVVLSTVGTLTINSFVGAIAMAATSLVNVSNQNLRIEAQDNITISRLDVGAGSVSLISANGSVVDAGTSTANVIAAALRVDTGGSVGSGADPIETDVGTIAGLIGGSGNYVENNGSIVIGAIDPVEVNEVQHDGTVVVSADLETMTGLNTRASSNGSIVVRALGGSIAVDNPVGADGSGNVLLESDNSDITLNANVTSGSGHVSVLAGLDVNQNATIQLGGTLDVTGSGGSITMSNEAQGISGNGNIRYHATEDITLSGLDAGSGSISLVADNGSITDAGEAVTNLIAIAARIESAGSVGSEADAIETTLALIAIDAGGNVYMVESDSITIGTVGSVDVNRVQPDASTVVITDAGDLVGIDARGFEVGLSAGGAINVLDPITTNDLGLETTSGDVTLDGLVTAATAVLIDTAGAVVDGNGDAINVIADSLTVTSVNGIGSGNALETEIPTFNGTNTTSGNIELINVGVLDVTGVTNSGFGNIELTNNGVVSVSGDVTSGGQIEFVVDGGITIDATVTAESDINLTSNETDPVSADDDIALTENGSILSLNGDILLQAGDDITSAAGSTLSAPNGSLTMSVDFGDNDPFGATTNLQGTVDSTANLILGGPTNDVIDASDLIQPLIIIGGEGDDRIIGGQGPDVIYGGPGKDDINGNSGADIVIGGSGEDILKGGLNNDIIIGDQAELTIGGTVFDPQSQFLSDIGVDEDDIYGEEGDDILVGDSGRVEMDADKNVTSVRTIDATAGANDEIDGGDGDDTGFGGGGVDQLNGGLDTNVLFGDMGVIRLTSAGDRIEIVSTDFNTGHNDVINSGAGDDVIVGGFGEDEINGGAGNDDILGDNGRLTYTNGALTEIATTNPNDGSEDDLDGGEGEDTIFGGTAIDDISGGAGRNILIGDQGKIVFAESGLRIQVATTFNDIGADDGISSGSGDDVIMGGFGADKINGGAGNDEILGDNGVLDYTNGQLTSIATADPANGSDDILDGAAGNDTIFGGGGLDTITDDGGQNILIGDEGAITFDEHGHRIRVSTTFNDTGADDTINSGTGNDVIIGGSGADVINGGAGNDDILGDNGVLDYTNGALISIATADPSNGADDTLDGGDGNDTIFGGSGIDQITGGANQNILIGDEGVIRFTVSGDRIQVTTTFNDTGSDDTINSGDGDDVILGGAGADTINGGSGNDDILGDNGVLDYTLGKLTLIQTADPNTGDADVINGEAGDDTIVGGTGADGITGGLDTNIILGDQGLIRFAVNGERIEVSTTHNNLGADDNINSGTGDDIILGGAGRDPIKSGGGDDIVLGDNGRLSYTGGELTLIETVDPNTGAAENIDGEEGNDLIFGGAGADGLTGGAGQNILVGDEGMVSFATNGDRIKVATTNNHLGANDQLLSGDGDDVILGGFGEDKINGGGGNDDILGDNGSLNYTGSVLTTITSEDPSNGSADTIDGADGNDTIIGGTGADTITGGLDTNIILGDQGLIRFDTNGVRIEVSTMDHLFGAADDIKSGAGDDVILGGSGSDPILAGAGDDIVLGDNGRVEYTAGVLTLITTADVTTGATETINAGEGNDLVFGATGEDTIIGDLGNDILIGDYGFISFDTDGRREEISTTDSNDGANDTITGSEGDDILIGGFGQDDLQGQDGADVVLGDNGNLVYTSGNLTRVASIDPTIGDSDIIGGNEGDDVVVGGAGKETIEADEGNNIVIGDNGELIFDGPSGLLASAGSIATDTGADDIIFAGTGDDIVIGGAADDTIEAGSGNNTVLGDNGRALFDLDGDFVTVALIETTAPDDGGGSDTIMGDAGNNVVIGGLGADIITFADGVNTILGDNGRATFEGGSVVGVTSIDVDLGGDDIITVETGNNVLVGGFGDDSLSATNGFNVVLGDNGQASYAGGVENLEQIGSIAPEIGGNDSITTGAGEDVIVGGNGADTITAGDGNNVVIGDNGLIDYSEDNDLSTLDKAMTVHPLAGGGDDVISGGVGNNVIIGGLGSETITMTGGDNIIVGDNAEVLFSQGGLDRVRSLEPDLGALDDIVSGGEADIVIGGAAGDDLDAGDGQNIVIGDNGDLDFEPSTRRLISAETIAPQIGGNDVINTGAGADVIFGGIGWDDITSGDGDNVVLGDNGRLDNNVDNDLDTLDTVTTTASSAGGGDDSITSGNGNDILLGGLGSDSVSSTGGDNIAIGDNADIVYTAGQLTLIESKEPVLGADDVILTGAGADIIFGGTASDNVTAGAGSDVILGDHGRYDASDANGTVISSIFTAATDGGAGDWISAGGGDDDVVGGQGSDRVYGDGGDDNLIGGHNMAGGSDEGDLLDGGTGDDYIAGDNAQFVREAVSVSARMRVLVGETLYDLDGNVAVTGDAQPNPTGSAARSVVLYDNTEGSDFGLYGSDVIAGGAGDDTLFGQFGNDVIQGDGSIDIAMTDLLEIGSTALATDGDDYIEGNSGADTLFGNLGQDDLVGGSSTLFGLVAIEQRPDDADLIYGGAGLNATRNDVGDPGEEGHARDADVILGDNGNIYRIVGVNGTNSGEFLSFSYDTEGTLRLIPRAYGLLDYSANGVAGDDIGGADEIHGESGDDIILGGGADDILFGDGHDDDLMGGSGNDWISGGTGQDGILGDDGKIMTSRNGTAESLYGVEATTEATIETKSAKLERVIYATGELRKSVDLEPFEIGGDDTLYGGLGGDWIHGGAGMDAISGAEALEEFYTAPSTTPAIAFDESVREFTDYDENDPASRVDGHVLNFEAADDAGDYIDDGADVLFGDLGHDWLVGGTNEDHVYGGLGDDLIQLDDNLDTNEGANLDVDAGQWGEAGDVAYGGGGLDVLIANGSNDRMIDASGEFNSYIIPMNNFGAPTIIRAVNPATEQFLYDFSKADGADQTRIGEGLGTVERNGEPFGEVGLVAQGDDQAGEQNGSPSDPQNVGHGTDSTGGTGGDSGDGGSGGSGGGGDPTEPTDGNSGVGNGEDPAPPGNDGSNDADGATPGNPGNAGGNGKAKGKN